jgi:hypothetical protein
MLQRVETTNNGHSWDLRVFRREHQPQPLVSAKTSATNKRGVAFNQKLRQLSNQVVVSRALLLWLPRDRMVDFSHRSFFKERMTFNTLLCNLRSRSEGPNQR